MLSAFLLIIAAALTQTPSKPAPKAPPTPAGPDKLANFADDPVQIDSVGLTMRIPAGAMIQTSNIAAGNKVAILAGDTSWVINIQTPTTANPLSTVKDAAERTIQDLLSRNILRDEKTKDVVGSAGLVLSRVANLSIPGCPTPGERFYVSLPTLGKSDDTRTIYGYTIFKPGPNQYVAFELICSDKHLEIARRSYELSVATARFEDPETLALAKRDAVKTGIALLAHLTSDDFETACKEPQQWYRFFRPAASGLAVEAEERGYRGLRFFKGTRAQIDTRVKAGTPQAQASEANPAGYLAELSARQLLPTGVKSLYQLVDIQGIYFATPNRDQEAWSIRMVVKDGAGPASPGAKDETHVYTETCTRGGRSMTVVSDMPGQPNRTIMPQVPPEGYLSQVEKFLLPRLMIRTALEGEFGFYAYQTTTQSITLRRDTLGREPAMQGIWSVLTREREGVEPEKYLYKESGDLLRAELRDGIVMEPTPIETILKLWQSKGLPTK